MYVPQKKDFEIKKSTAKNTSDKANLLLHLDLSSFEKEILLKACKKYRAKIPSYLLSKQSELETIDRVIQKLI
jgi:hypothetical protein